MAMKKAFIICWLHARGVGESKLGAKKKTSRVPTFSHETNYSIGELGHDALTGIKEVKKAYAK